MFSFFTHINQERQKMEQSKKEMELRHNEFADRVRGRTRFKKRVF